MNPYSSNTPQNTLVEMFTEYIELINNWTDISNTSRVEDKKIVLSIRNELLHGNLGIFQHIGEANSSQLGHRLDSFILSCQIQYVEGLMEKSMPCNDAFVDIRPIVDPNYLNCFNIHLSMSAIRKLFRGLVIVLYFDTLEKEDLIQTTRMDPFILGGIMGLHEAGTSPFSKGYNLEIMPGKVNIIRFEKEKRVRLPYPYNNCLQDRRKFKLSSFKQEYVASIIELYKNNGAVSCVAINFLFIWSLYLAITLLIMSRFARNEKQCLS